MMAMNYCNIEVRELIAARRVYYYELAEKIGISPYTLSVWLRKELTPEHKERILKGLESFN